MADKYMPLILDALTLAAAEPGGVPLYASKAEAGLFPNAAAGKTAARKALDDGLIRVVAQGPGGKSPRELLTATEKGLRMLVETVSPRKVLEDFVRILEAREAQVEELVTSARRLAESVAGMRAAVAAVLPQVTDGAGAPKPTAAEAASEQDDLAGTVLGRLSDWASSAAVGQDCPLPELFRSLSLRAAPPSLGAFHDCVRRLHEAHRIYLHPWTGPLYAIPEPATALLVGHNVAYYASPRRAD